MYYAIFIYSLFFIFIQTAEKINEERKAAFMARDKSKLPEHDTEVVGLREEQESLLQFIPSELLNNLPPELADTLRISIADERSKLVAKVEETSAEDEKEESVDEKKNVVQLAEGTPSGFYINLFCNCQWKQFSPPLSDLGLSLGLISFI